MRAGDDIVLETVGAERAAIADPMIEHAPSVRQIVSIDPDHARHIAEVTWLVASQAERDEVAQCHASSLNHVFWAASGPRVMFCSVRLTRLRHGEDHFP